MIRRSEKVRIGEDRAKWFMVCNGCGLEAFAEYSRSDVLQAAKAAGWANYFRFDTGQDFCPECANEISDAIVKMKKRLKG